MNNTHETKVYNGDSNLDTDSILYSTPEFLNLKMLLQPFEEEFDQPSFLVKFYNFKSCKLFGVGEKSEFTFFFPIIVFYNSECLWILSSVADIL